MKKVLAITATILLTALVPFTFLFFASRNYSSPLTAAEEDFFVQESISKQSPLKEIPETDTPNNDAAYNYDFQDVSQETHSVADEVSLASIRDILSATTYRETYDPDMMVKKPETKVLSSSQSASLSDADEVINDAADLDITVSDTVETSSTNATLVPSITPVDTPPSQTSQLSQPSQTPAPQLPTVTTPVINSGAVNPLTGLSFDSAWNPWNGNLNKNRPWAVSIGNTADAMPLWGIGSADIICEFVVESFATRFLAIYQDISNVGRIGGIRSLRTSSMEIAASFDAIFAHWGGRTYDNVVPSGTPVSAYGTIDASSLGSRDPSKVAPNNAIVNNGAELISRLPEAFRTTHCDLFKHGFTFADVGTPLNGVHADTVTVSFSDRTTKKTTFSYDYYAGKYYVSQFGADLIDGNTNEKLSFTNVLVIQTDMQFDCNESGHTYIRTTGTGAGYFINGRKYVPIMWSRSDLSSPYSYYLADGTPLKLGAGKTYICMVQNNQTPLFA